jgi:hypothetical protein
MSCFFDVVLNCGVHISGRFGEGMHEPALDVQKLRVEDGQNFFLGGLP